ncbi:MAG: carboxypeptidase regulatory-like domain-containing protein [Gemmatimonadaceae bacterium]
MTRKDAAVRRDLRLHPAPGELIRVSGATRQSEPGVLRGYVYDENGAPVPGVSVRLPGSSYTGLTDEAGRFLIRGVHAGRYSVEARALGFSPLEASVSLQAGDTAKVNFVLNRSVTTLSRVLTIGEPSAFERTSGFGERRGRGNGLFFDRVSIERRGSQRITDLVRGAPGFTLQPVFNRWGQSYDVRMDRVVVAGANACQIDYYLNGNQYTPSSAGIDHDFPAQQVEAVEVYRPSEVPAQFSGQRSRCGVIVIWTRYHAYDIP